MKISAYEELGLNIQDRLRVRVGLKRCMKECWAKEP